MNKKNISIQIMRIIAMFLIVICHLCNYSNNKVISYLGNFFDVGVFIFFLISGYLYGNKKIDNNFRWLLKKVIVVLFPMYVFVIFITCVNVKLTGIFDYKSILNYLLNIQYFTSSMRGAGHLWFISVIMVCYLLVPILNKFKTIIINKKSSILITVMFVSFVAGLFSKTIGLLGFYILTFYIGYLIKNNEFQVFSLSIIKTSLMIATSVIVRLFGKFILDDTLFYETTIVGITHLIIAIALFVIIYKYTSKLNICNGFILNKINLLDGLSYYIFIVHYMYIAGPICLLNITNYYILNLLIFAVITVLTAYALKSLVDAILGINVKQWNLVFVLQFVEVLLVVIYKYLLSYNYRQNLVLLPMAFLAGIIFIIIFWIKRKQYKKHDLVVFVILTLLSAVTVFTLKSINLVFPILIAMSFYNENPKKIAENFFWTLLVGYIITLSLNAFNILPDHNLSRTTNGIEYIRYGLGFSNVAFVMLYYIFIILAAYYAYGSTKKFIILANFGGTLLYALSLSRTALVCLIFLDIILLIDKYFEKFNKILKYTVPYAFLLLTILAIGFTILSKYCDMPIINKFLNGRVKFNLEALERGYFTTAFGIREKLDIPLDMYYLYPLVKFGIVGCIIYSLLTCLSLYRLRNDKALMITQIIVLLYGLGDTNVIVSSINFVISVQVLALINDKNARIKGDLIYEKRKN